MWVQVGSLVRNPSSHVYYYQTYRNRYFKKGKPALQHFNLKSDKYFKIICNLNLF